jgi:uncharacterized protein
VTKRAGTEEARGLRPRAFTLELTKGCNLRCGYCYYADRDQPYDPRARMTPEVARASVDTLIREGPTGEPFHLHFFGGEPLLHFELLKETVLYAEAEASKAGKSASFELTTNGTRFGDEVIAFVNAHAIHVGVSFDGLKELQDEARPARGASSYDLAVPGIRRFLASRKGTPLAAKTHCTVVLTRRSTDLRAIVRHVEELGFEKIVLAPVTDLDGRSNGYRDEDLPALYGAFDELAEDYERAALEQRGVATNWFPLLMGRLLSGERKTHFCQGGLDYLGVAADGKVSLCYRFYEDPAFGMGSLATGIERGVTERLLAHDLESRTACSACWARWFCGGGCHHDNVRAGGGLGEPNPVTCDLFRHSMGRTLEIWGRLSRRGVLPRRPNPPPETAAMNGSPGTAAPTDHDRERPRRSRTCHVRDLDGEKVVYEPTSHEVVVLNATAARIFELCDGERTVGEILASLEHEFEAPEAVLRADLAATLTDLRARRLLSG